MDGLPFIGRNAMSERVYVATGFSGNGLTFGTLAALMLRDACLDAPNRYAELYSATRVESLAALPTFIGENIDFPLHLLSDVFRPPRGRVARRDRWACRHEPGVREARRRAPELAA